MWAASSSRSVTRKLYFQTWSTEPWKAIRSCSGGTVRQRRAQRLPISTTSLQRRRTRIQSGLPGHPEGV
jgi:hypothetical protein